MADTQTAPSQYSMPSTQRQGSPPSSPPSPDAESDLKSSRKREREVSLEPAPTSRTAVDIDPLTREQRETRTPAKKNRIHLSTTEEEEDGSHSRSNSGSPPLSASPPQEMKMKVRQISQGVEDISWRNMKAVTPDRDLTVDSKAAIYTDTDEQVANTRAEDSAPTQIEADDYASAQDPPESRHSQSPTDRQTKRRVNRSDSVTVGSSSRRDSDSDSGEKGLKRKFLERGTSQGPQENGDASTSAPEPLKRPRDDADKDDNPRETKRPSPPPESTKKSPPTAPAPKLGGFMAYASTSSPFASIKGQNVFSSNKSTPSPIPFSTTPPPAAAPFTPFGVIRGESSTSTAAKRTGFEAFTSSASLFASATRSKSPVLGSALKLNRNKSPPRRTNSSSVNAFSSYAGPVQSFAVPAQKRARAGSPSGGSSRSSLERYSTVSVFSSNGGTDSGEDERDDRPSSFGERLRAGKDEDEDGRSEEEQPKISLTEQEVTTGEEDEDTVHQVRGKLYSLEGAQWKERGTGILRLNVRRSDGSGARLVMRKEAVYTLLLNVTLFHGMRCVLAQDPRYLRFSGIENGITTHYNLRVSNAKIAQELLEEINANIPSA